MNDSIKQELRGYLKEYQEARDICPESIQGKAWNQLVKLCQAIIDEDVEKAHRIGDGFCFQTSFSEFVVPDEVFKKLYKELNIIVEHYLEILDRETNYWEKYYKKQENSVREILKRDLEALKGKVKWSRSSTVSNAWEKVYNLCKAILDGNHQKAEEIFKFNFADFLDIQSGRESSIKGAEEAYKGIQFYLRTSRTSYGILYPETEEQ